MKRNVIIFISALMFLLTSAAYAKTTSFVGGTDYQVIEATIPDNLKLTVPHKIVVTEFFSYGCPACSKLDPTLTAWVATQPSTVEFNRVPVVFHPEWQLLAKAYYAEKNLNAISKIHTPLFAAIHTDNQVFKTKKDLEDFFIKHGVKKEDFESVFEFSPGINAQVQRSQDLMNTYKIFEIPTLVINGKYKTNLHLVGGDTKKLMQVVDYLVAKERKAN